MASAATMSTDARWIVVTKAHKRVNDAEKEHLPAIFKSNEYQLLGPNERANYRVYWTF